MGRLTLSVGGMTCADCTARIEQMLAAMAGMNSFTLSLLSGRAKLDVDEASGLTTQAIIAAIVTLGFTADEVPDGGTSVALPLLVVAAGGAADGRRGAAAVAAALLATPGVTSAPTRSASSGGSAACWPRATTPAAAAATIVDVTYDASLAFARDLLAVAQAAAPPGAAVGLCPPALAHPPGNEEAAVRSSQLRLAAAVLTGVPACILAYAIPQRSPHADDGTAHGLDGVTGLLDLPLGGAALLTPRSVCQWLLATVMLAVVGWPLALSAWAALVHSRMLTMDTLVSAAASLAYAYSVALIAMSGAHALRESEGGGGSLTDETLFESTTILLALVAVGRWVEHAAKRSTASELGKLKRRLEGGDGGGSGGGGAWLVSPLAPPAPAAPLAGGKGDDCCSSGACSGDTTPSSGSSGGDAQPAVASASINGSQCGSSAAKDPEGTCGTKSDSIARATCGSLQQQQPESCCAPDSSSSGCCSAGVVSTSMAGWAPQRGEAVTLARTPLALLQLGDVVLVPAGVLFPADGTLLDLPPPGLPAVQAQQPRKAQPASEWGEACTTALPSPSPVSPGSADEGAWLVGTSADESVVTGEAAPVPKGPGAALIGGSVNVGAPVLMRLTCLPSTGTVARVLTLIDDAQGARPQVQLQADRVASWFTPGVFAVAALAFICWTALGAAGLADTHGHTPAGYGIAFAITLLIVSCPCAISLAVPTAVYVGTQVAATRCGALVKGGPALERLASVKHVVFDKTGTLTCGRPLVTAVRLLVPERTAAAAAASVGIGGVSVVVPVACEQQPLRGGGAAEAPPAGAVAVAVASSSSSSGSGALALGVLSKAQAAVLAAAAVAEAGATHPLATAVLETAAARVRYSFKPPPPPKQRGAAATDDAALEPVRASIPGQGVVLSMPSSASAASGGGCGGGGASSGKNAPQPAGSQTGRTADLVRVGSIPWLTAQPPASAWEPVEVEDEEELAAAVGELEAGGATVVGLALQGTLVALIACADALRPDAAATVRELARAGITAWLASGDAHAPVARVAAAVGIPPHRAFGRMTPQGKAELVGRIRAGAAGAPDALAALAAAAASLPASSSPPGAAATGSKQAAPSDGGAAAGAGGDVEAARLRPSQLEPAGPVLMVGDGVNDGVALAAADVGVAMGGGTTVALDTADVVLQRHPGSSRYLAGLTDVLRLGALVRDRIWWNFAWAVVYNVIAMPLAAGVFVPANAQAAIPPGLAGASELLSSVPVVLGSLLLFRFRPSAAKGG